MARRHPVSPRALLAGALVLAIWSTSGALLRADSRPSAILDGRVLDAAGNALAEVAVTLAGVRGERSATTGGDGRFLFGGLAPGDYVARAALAGFAPVERTARLAAGERLSMELRLALATAQSIDVVAAAPLLERHRPGAASTVAAATIGELAFPSRNYHAVVGSLPGVAHPGSPLAELTPEVNGGVWQENAAFLDGVDITDTRFGGGSRMFLPASFLAEVSSEASGRGVEYGRAVGGVTTAVTRSGSNVLHGDLLLVVQNPSWRAPSDVVAVDRDDRPIASPEASLGGPLRRDRAWFFAAAGETTTNRVTPLAGGETIDGSLEAETLVGKLSFDVSPRHQLSVTALDGVGGSSLALPQTAEPAAVTGASRGGSFVTASWAFGASAKRFLETRAARQRSESDRTPLAFAPSRPGAGPDEPGGNQGTYWDSASGLRWHASDLPLGPGSLAFPRDQANLSLTWLLERHQLELGADYQDVAWEALNRPPDRYLGSGYDPGRPGGFVTPDLKRVFLPIDSPVGTYSSNRALFAQDRIDLGARLAVTFGLRLEDQAHDDESGSEVLASTDLAPRASAVYDVAGRGRLLVKGTVGRYTTHIAQEFLNQEFASLPNGANAFDEFLWNPATLRYDRFNRRQLPAQRRPAGDVEPYARDEVTAAVEWQPTSGWALEARVIAWRIDAPFSATDQFDGEGGVFRLLSNFPEGEREYRGLQLEANRAFRDGFVVRANYTLARIEGNSLGSHDGDDFLEAMAVEDVATGLPVTAVHRHGRLDHDRTHILNLAGAKRWELGRHSWSLGGWLAHRSGEPWGRRSTVALRSPASQATILTTRFDEPRDSHELPDASTLNLTMGWEFPLSGRASGSLRAEILNATDEQEQIAVSHATGLPVPVPQSYQMPRELRWVAGIRF